METNPIWFFVTDLHGHIDRYEKLFEAVRETRPQAVLLGGDLLPSMGLQMGSPELRHIDFVDDFLVARCVELRNELGSSYPEVLLILGNDDPRLEEAAVLHGSAQKVWHYAHGRKTRVGAIDVYGYSFVPPTPFQLKDWERYDVSRFVDPGCVSPEEGARTIPVSEDDARWRTIADDLETLVGSDDVTNSVFLFHSPPYKTKLDRAALDGQSVDHAPLDVHVGSIAIQRFIEKHQPAVTLHGHVHESARITGAWKEELGRTVAMTAAHDGPELALVELDPAYPEAAVRRLL